MRAAALILVVVGCSSSPPSPPSNTPSPAASTPGVAIRFAVVGEAGVESGAAVDRTRARLVELGIAEPAVRESSDQLIVELRGDDASRAGDVKRALLMPGRWSIHWVDNNAAAMQAIYASFARRGDAVVLAETDRWTGPNGAAFEDVYLEAETREALRDAFAGAATGDRIVGFERFEKHAGGGLRWRSYWLEKTPFVTDSDVEATLAKIEPSTNEPVVVIDLTPDGRERFGRQTGANLGKKLAIILDGVVTSAPVVQDRIDGGTLMMLVGRGDDAERRAHDIARALKSGPLPELKVVSEAAL